MNILENIDLQFRALQLIHYDSYQDEYLDEDMKFNFIEMIWHLKDDFGRSFKKYVIGKQVKPKIPGIDSTEKWYISDFELRSSYVEYEVRDRFNNKNRFYSWELDCEF